MPGTGDSQSPGSPPDAGHEDTAQAGPPCTLADLQEAIAAARTEASRLPACFRRAAGRSQLRLAGKIGYSATAAHAELACRPVSAKFWELADDALTADGNLTTGGAPIRNLAAAMREERRRQDMAEHTRQLAQLLPGTALGPRGSRQGGPPSRAAAPPGAGTGQEPAAGTPADPGGTALSSPGSDAVGQPAVPVPPSQQPDPAS